MSDQQDDIYKEEIKLRDNDNDEEEEEGQDEYEKDGFIVDDVEEEEQDGEEEKDSEEEEKQKKKKRNKRESEKNYVLDEDDYELLQDNNITGFRWPKLGGNKFRRLKKTGWDAEQEEQSRFSNEEEIDKSSRSGRTAEEKLKRSLFGDDEGPPLEDIAEEEEQPEEEDMDIGEEDEMADFIVDEEEVDKNGAPVRRRKPCKKKSRPAIGVSSSALQEAREIFVVVNELLMLLKQRFAKVGSYDDFGEWREKRLEDEFESFILTENYLTEKDDRIRKIDVPERIQVIDQSRDDQKVDLYYKKEEALCRVSKRKTRSLQRSISSQG
ncbi:transcription elongation factor SPT6 homolog [Tasmannia lanceolata]|uniref:transcription elongation factor SPT6 homolog n=1 Tax=Tasmannia lanceolata TaxID=3420 RepID=UPI004062B8E3